MCQGDVVAEKNDPAVSKKQITFGQYISKSNLSQWFLQQAQAIL